MEMIRLDPPAALDMAIGEAMFTQRAIRRLQHDRPITDEQLEIILDAATKAPSGGNAQIARHLVIRDRDLIRDFGALYHEAWWAKRRDEFGWTSEADIPEGSLYRMPSLLAREMVDAPAVILALSVPNPIAPASVFPGVQNMLLAARALGIGSVLTTLHPSVMDRVYSLLGIPDEILFHCCIPLGYPRGDFGPTTRYPSARTTSWDRWENSPPWG
jgi:nitroreductase